jgi:hypothetical protein
MEELSGMATTHTAMSSAQFISWLRHFVSQLLNIHFTHKTGHQTGEIQSMLIHAAVTQILQDVCNNERWTMNKTEKTGC